MGDENASSVELKIKSFNVANRSATLNPIVFGENKGIVPL